MIRYVLGRLGWTLLVMWFVVSVTFAMITWIPAEPARALLGPHATPDAIQRVRAHYCLDEGFAGRYGCYVGRLAQLDLGESFRTHRAVGDVIAERFWPTAQLALAAMLLQLCIGVPLGMWAARRRRRWPDHVTSAISLLGQSAPTFFVGTVLLYVFAYALGWFPLGGYGTGLVGRLHHLVLPAATLATLGVAYYARLVRNELVETLDADFIRTARAKGLDERQIVTHHALRNALGPVVALAGIDLGVLLGGAIVTEYIFSWPGLGREVLQAILEVDIPLILGVVLVSAAVIALANLLVDLFALKLDPRLRDGS
jgi:peptide/nickel transport system permease protein